MLHVAQRGDAVGGDAAGDGHDEVVGQGGVGRAVGAAQKSAQDAGPLQAPEVLPGPPAALRAQIKVRADAE